MLRFSRSISKLSKSQIRQLLETPKWSTSELLQPHPTNISKQTLIKILKLSGLSADMSPAKEAELLDSLRAQMLMIQRLYEDAPEDNTGSNEEHFRLLASDHNPPKPLDLKGLMSAIKDVAVDENKGEAYGTGVPYTMKR